MKKFLIISVVSLLLTVQIGYSQEKNNKENKIDSKDINFLIGFSASSISGIGPSFQYYFSPSYHLKVTALYVEQIWRQFRMCGGSDYKHDPLFNGGVEFQRNIYMSKNNRHTFQIYTLIGASFWYKNTEKIYDKTTENRKKVTVGSGVGTGWILANRVSFNVDIGCEYSNWINKKQMYFGIGGGGGFNFVF